MLSILTQPAAQPQITVNYTAEQWGEIEVGARQAGGREGEVCALKIFMLQISMCFKPVILQIFI